MLTVFIPTAGLGSRLKSKSKNQNKSLITLNNKAIISHIIEKFNPKKTEFIIALGHKADYVKQYLIVAHPSLKLKFIQIDKFKGKGSGLGYTLYKSKYLLQKAFLFHPCDAIISDNFPLLRKKENVVFYKTINDNGQYRSLSLRKKSLLKINEKILSKKSNLKAYTGVAYINDYEEFWKYADLKNIKFVKSGESFLINKTLKHKNFSCKKLNWHDTGNLESLNLTTKNFYQKKKIRFKILEKDNECIFFTNKKVIKFHESKTFVSQRVRRSKILKNFVPQVENYTKNYYSYNYINGSVFSSKLSHRNFNLLIKFLKKFWSIKNKKQLHKNIFKKNCIKFYKTKTLQRVNQFDQKYNLEKIDKFSYINNFKVNKIHKILNNLDWDMISNGIQSNFHGDLHFENIIIDKKKKFKLLDWRQNFNGNLNTGDLYYDLAKIKHGLIINHSDVINNIYSFKQKKNKKISLSFRHKNIYKISINLFNMWLKKEGYDIKKVNIITALIFINIAPLHHHPYSIFLFFLGKLLLENPYYFDVNKKLL